MSSMPWNEYALRCELRLVLENDQDFLRRGGMRVSELSRLSAELCKKYGVQKFTQAYHEVLAGLLPEDSKYKGYKPHYDSCIPGTHEYNAAQIKAAGKTAGAGADALTSILPPSRDLPDPWLANTIVKQQEETMTPPIEITTKTLINGADISLMGDASIYDIIAREEDKIKALGEIKAKPKKLVAEIAKRQAGIDALVAHLDSKE